jgi:hypothetical protein
VATSQPGTYQPVAGSAVSDGGSYGASFMERTTGSVRGHSEGFPAPAIASGHLSPREPTRSFFHSSFRGHLGMGKTKEHTFVTS